MRLLSHQTLLVGILMLLASVTARADVTIDDAAKALPDKLASFRAQGPAQMPMRDILELVSAKEVGAISSAARTYANDNGATIVIHLIRLETDAGAYALLTRIASNTGDIKPGIVGRASILFPSRVVFCKDVNLVEVESLPGSTVNQELLFELARSFAVTLQNGDEDLPVLVKHLPNWQSTFTRASYAISFEGLKNIVLSQPIINELSFEGGTEAVTANYGQSQLVIVEFTTPQFAGDNDRRIVAKVQELKSLGQPVPSAYRRVGNYSVFVFNAPDERAANQLIDQVKYEQVVQWLGDDPHLAERLERLWGEAVGGVFIAVVKSSGVLFVICLGIGAVIGTLLFRHRRARKAAFYSDAGGTVRLNLDELTGTSDPRRLLKSRKHGKPDSAGS